MSKPAAEPISVNSREAARLTGFGLRTLQDMTKAGDVPPARQKGRSYIYVVDELRDWVAALPRPGEKADGN